MEHDAVVQPDLSADETKELARLVAAMVGVMLLFSLAGVAIVLETGDPASVAGTAVMVVLGALLFQGRRQLLRGHGGRAAMLLVAIMLLVVLVSAPIPPPVPALAAVPIMAVAFALSFLHGRRLVASLVAAFLVSIAAAIMIEMTPPSPDLPSEIAVLLRVFAMAAVTGPRRTRPVPPPRSARGCCDASTGRRRGTARQ